MRLSTDRTENWRNVPADSPRAQFRISGFGLLAAAGLIVAAVSAVAWVRHEEIVVWMLAQGMAGEGSADALLARVRTVAVISGATGLAAAWRLYLTIGLQMARFQPVAALIRLAAKLIGPPAHAVGYAATAAAKLAAAVAAYVTGQVRAGAGLVVRAVGSARQHASNLIEAAYSLVAHAAGATSALAAAVARSVTILVIEAGRETRRLTLLAANWLIGILALAAVLLTLSLLRLVKPPAQGVATTAQAGAGLVARAWTSATGVAAVIVHTAMSGLGPVASTAGKLIATASRWTRLSARTAAAGVATFLAATWSLLAAVTRSGVEKIAALFASGAALLRAFGGAIAQVTREWILEPATELVSGTKRAISAAASALGTVTMTLATVARRAGARIIRALYEAFSAMLAAGRLVVVVPSRKVIAGTTAVARAVHSILAAGIQITARWLASSWQATTAVSSATAWVVVRSASGIRIAVSKVAAAILVATAAAAKAAATPAVRLVAMVLAWIGFLSAGTAAVAGTFAAMLRAAGATAFTGTETVMRAASSISARSGTGLARVATPPLLVAKAITLQALQLLRSFLALLLELVTNSQAALLRSAWKLATTLAAVAARAFRPVSAAVAAAIGGATLAVTGLFRAGAGIASTTGGVLVHGASLIAGFVRDGTVCASAAARSVAGRVAHGTAVLGGAFKALALQLTGVLSMAARTVGAGIATSLRPAAIAVRDAWKLTAAIVHTTASGTASAAAAGGTATTTAAQLLATGVRQIAGAVVYTAAWATRPAVIAITAIGAQLKFGLTTALEGVAIVTGAIAAAPALLLRALLRVMQAGGRVVANGFAAVPDAARFLAVLVRHRNGGYAMTETNMNQSRALSLAVTAVVLSLFIAVPVRIFWPAPPEPVVNVVHWTTGHLTREGLMFEMAREFNRQGHRTADGVRIKVEVYNVPSELQGKYVSELIRFGTRRNLARETNGYVVDNIPDPTILTPSSAHWLVTTNFEVEPEIGHPVARLDQARSIVQPVIGIVTYTEMARCLGWPGKEIGFQDIIDLRDDPRGWKKYECAKTDWGVKPLLAFTDPITSSTGRSLHLALYAMAAGKQPQELQLADVSDPDVVAAVRRFQGLIDHYQIGTTVLNTKVHQGPKYGHFFIMPEDNLIHLYEGTEQAFINGIQTTAPPIVPDSMVMLYPKEGSMPRKNCACVMDAEWVTDEQAAAAERWIDFILEDKQQRTFMASGFRPGTDLDMNAGENRAVSRITSEFGLDPAGPGKVLNPSLTRPEVAAAIDAAWEDVKRPGIVTFVLDTSGSMLGGKIAQAGDGLVRALDSMASNNHVGLLTFGDEVDVNVLPGPLAETRWDIGAAATDLRAKGETALFDALRMALVQTDAAEGPDDAIRAVVVLTDGQANIGTVRLDDLVTMRVRGTEALIREWDGYEGSVAVDVRGGRHESSDVAGAELALGLGLVHEVQVFMVAIGEDADIEVGRILAEATGAEFVGVTEQDLAQVIEEFSNYF